MDLARYFMTPHFDQALRSYSSFTAAKRSPIREKFHLYNEAKRAFGNVRAGDPAKRAAFEEIYRTLRAYWQVFRNGESYWDADKTYEALRVQCRECSRESRVTLVNLTQGQNGARVKRCLAFFQDIKKLRSGRVKPMPFSKFLHFFNPKLFPIYDTAFIKGKVLTIFRDDWTGFCADQGLNHQAEGTELYFNYLLWANTLLSQGDAGLMEGFAEWFKNQVKGRNDSEGVLNEVSSYFATAFEFVAIGAALLEGEHSTIPPPEKRFGQYLVADPQICHGKLTFTGTRILVEDVLDMVAAGMDWDSIVREWGGSVSREAIGEAVSFAKMAFLDHADDYVEEFVQV